MIVKFTDYSNSLDIFVNAYEIDIVSIHNKGARIQLKSGKNVFVCETPFQVTDIVNTFK